MFLISFRPKATAICMSIDCFVESCWVEEEGNINLENKKEKKRKNPERKQNKIKKRKKQNTKQPFPKKKTLSKKKKKKKKKEKIDTIWLVTVHHNRKLLGKLISIAILKINLYLVLNRILRRPCFF